MKKIISIFVISSFIFLGLLVGPKVQAQSFSDMSFLASLQSTIDLLQKQVNELQSKLRQAQETSQNENSGLRESISINQQLPSEQACPAIKVMNVGARGDDVTRVQTLLNKAGFYPEGVISKYYGGLTRKAVIKFQQAQGISETGNIDESTSEALSQIASNYLADCGIINPPRLGVPVIKSLTPSNGPVGTMVVIDGSAFTDSLDIAFVGSVNMGSPINVEVHFSWNSAKGDIVNFPVLATITGFMNRGSDATTTVNVVPGKYYVVLESKNGKSAPAYFNVTATSTQPSITVLSPNGGEQWQIGNSYTVSWATTNAPVGSDVGLGIYKGGFYIKSFVYHLPTSGSYSWVVKDFTPGNDYKVEANLYNASGTRIINDSSNASFSIISATSTQPTLSVATDSANPSAAQLVMGTVDNSVFAVRFSAGSSEDIKITDLTFRDTITNNTAGHTTFKNMKVYDGSTLIGGSNTPSIYSNVTSTVTFSFGTPVTVLKNSSKILVLKGDVQSFNEGAVSNSGHTWSINVTSDVVAYGKDSNGRANIYFSGIVSGNNMTVYRTKLNIASNVIGSVYDRSRAAIEDLAAVNWTANPANDLLLKKVKLTFSGSAILNGTSPFIVNLLKSDGTAFGSATEQICSPGAGNSCSVIFNPNVTISAGVTQGTKVRVNSSSFYNGYSLGGISLTILINTTNDIEWSDSITGSIGLESNIIPFTVANMTYEGGGAPINYLLTVAKSGTGQGQVTSINVGGINCGTDCTENYNSGTNVQLLAKPLSSTSTFASWSGCDGVTSTICVVTMNGNKNVTANFTAVGNTAPKITGGSTIPVTVTVGRQVGFSWNAIDSDNDDLSWNVSWGDGTGIAGACLSPNPQNQQGWTFSTSHAWAVTGSYLVNVTVSDCRGGTAGAQFTVTATLPQPKLPIASSFYDAIESQLNDITATLQELLKQLQ